MLPEARQTELKAFAESLADLARGFAELVADLCELGLPLAVAKQECVASHPRA